MYYHDQGQTPEVSGGDGQCPTVGGCNCGRDLPCGEYLWDHRNGTQLRKLRANNCVQTNNPQSLRRPQQHGGCVLYLFFLLKVSPNLCLYYFLSSFGLCKEHG